MRGRHVGPPAQLPKRHLRPPCATSVAFDTPRHLVLDSKRKVTDMLVTKPQVELPQLRHAVCRHGLDTRRCAGVQVLNHIRGVKSMWIIHKMP
jgi:hypothetical protein